MFPLIGLCSEMVKKQLDSEDTVSGIALGIVRSAPMTEIRDIEVDFKVYDGYVAFSAEIVHLALLSPAACAFFIALAGKDVTPEKFLQLIAPGRAWLSASLVCMALVCAIVTAQLILCARLLRNSAKGAICVKIGVLLPRQCLSSLLRYASTWCVTVVRGCLQGSWRGLTIRSSRNRFVTAKAWQEKLAMPLPSLRGSA